MQPRQSTVATRDPVWSTPGRSDQYQPSQIRPVCMTFPRKNWFLQTLSNFAPLVAIPANCAESAPYDRCLKTIGTYFLFRLHFFRKNKQQFIREVKNSQNTTKIDEIWSKSMDFGQKSWFSSKKRFLQTLSNFTPLVAIPANCAESAPYDRCLKTIETDFWVPVSFFQEKHRLSSVRRQNS